MINTGEHSTSDRGTTPRSRPAIIWGVPASPTVPPSDTNVIISSDATTCPAMMDPTQHDSAHKLPDRMTTSGGPIDDIKVFYLRENMHNGDDPAGLRLRVAPIELLNHLLGRLPLAVRLLLVPDYPPEIRTSKRYINGDTNRMCGRHHQFSAGDETTRAQQLEQVLTVFFR